MVPIPTRIAWPPRPTKDKIHTSCRVHLPRAVRATTSRAGVLAVQGGHSCAARAARRGARGDRRSPEARSHTYAPGRARGAADAGPRSCLCRAPDRSPAQSRLAKGSGALVLHSTLGSNQKTSQSQSSVAALHPTASIEPAMSAPTTGMESLPCDVPVVAMGCLLKRTRERPQCDRKPDALKPSTRHWAAGRCGRSRRRGS